MHFPKQIPNKKTLQQSWIARASNVLGEINWHVNPNNIKSPRITDTPIIKVTTDIVFQRLTKHLPHLIWTSTLANANGTHIIPIQNWMKLKFKTNTSANTKRELYAEIRKTLTHKGKWNPQIKISKIKHKSKTSMAYDHVYSKIDNQWVRLKTLPLTPP